jgi:polyketide synthase PksM
LVKAEENLFLPLYYESFRAAALINRCCYSYVPVSSIKRKNDLLSYSIYFFDNTGKKIGELINLTAKMVREGIKAGEGIKTPERGEIKMPAGEGGIIVFLKQVIGAHLNMDPDIIGVNLGYYNMGFDSVSLLQLAGVIGARIGADLPPTLLFEYPDISSLADHLSNTYAEKFEPLKVVESE